MNDKERRVFDFIKEKSKEGITPSIREICAALGIKSTSTAARYVNSLAEKGFLEKIDGLNRSIRLAGKNAAKIPIVRKIKAGQPISEITNAGDYITFHEDKSYTGELFAIKVKDDSMVDAAILINDIAVVETCKDVKNGELAAVVINESEIAVRTLYKEKEAFRLQPENALMEPIIVENCEVIGRIVAVLRYYSTD
ncbi:MAG: transcriptional repressor LexA [Oscillospiraceae bacterium]|nr:transcriptional repressor LexA [Oscillospiraceae bacterium]